MVSRSVVLLTATVASVGAWAEVRGPAVGELPLSGPRPEAAVCDWRSTSIGVLHLEGSGDAFIEPRTLAVQPESLLLAGHPVYVWDRPLDAPEPNSLNKTLLGAVVAPDGLAHPIPALTLPGLAGAVSIIPEGDGSWTVAFAEIVPGTRFPAAEVAGRLGVGRHDGERWLSNRWIPLPSDVTLNALESGPLLRTQDALVWALRTREPAERNGLALLRLDGAGPSWQVDHDFILGFDVAISSAGRVLVVSSRIDADVPDDRGSLFVSSAFGATESPRKVEGGRLPTYAPRFEARLDPHWIAWLKEPTDPHAGFDAYARPIEGGAPPRGPRLIAGNADQLFGAGRTEDDGALWVVSRRPPENDILLVEVLADGAVHVRLRGENPFAGPFIAVPDDGRVVLAGPVRGPPGSAPVVTTLMQFEQACDGKK